MRKTLIAAVAVVASLVIVPSAFAWNGAKITSVSCPEIHASLPVENGNWQVWAVEGGKTVFGPVQVPGFAGDQVIGSFYEPDNLTHHGVMYAASAANPRDGLVSLPYQASWCAAPVGSAGPAGPAGPTGPKGDPGVAGKDGVTTTITIERSSDLPKKCAVSKRKVTLTLPKALRNVHAVTSLIGGHKRTLTVRNGKVILNFSGMRCGQYAVRITKKKVGHVQLLYTLGGEHDGGGNLTAYNLPPRT